MLTFAMLTTFTSDTVFGTANTYYCRYFLDNPNHIGTFATIMNVFKIGSMILILPIVLRTIGKRNALMFACAVIACAALIRFIDPYSATVAFIAAAIWGFGQGFTYACVFAMLPDCVEQLTVLKNIEKCVNILLLRAHIRLDNLLNWYAVPQLRSDVGRLKVKSLVNACLLDIGILMIQTCAQ